MVHRNSLKWAMGAWSVEHERWKITGVSASTHGGFAGLYMPMRPHIIRQPILICAAR